ncbi:MAG: hypothetical protein LQ351_001360 [Letrouitia transgressa]|nr:MAG: hypothetical protein LQ351_001360 [Letrouitia transgressa]
MPLHPVFRAGHVALITGAASGKVLLILNEDSKIIEEKGIGLAVAKLCRSHGMKLALVDISAESLSNAKHSLDNGILTETYARDVSKLDQWHDLKSSVEQSFGGVDFLMLNAGIGLKGGWEDSDYFHKVHSICQSLCIRPGSRSSKSTQVIDTNVFGVLNGIATFLPTVRRQEHPTSIVITGSKQGITNPPGNPAYNASKSAVKTLAEHLSYDLRSSVTSVHLLVPGWTFTGMTGGAAAKEKPAGAWRPEQVAKYLEEKMAEDVFYIICPDNDVTAEVDKKRILWNAEDIANDRKPLSRWRDEYRTEVEEWMAK